MLPSTDRTAVMRYCDPACEALLQQLGKGARITQPVLLAFTGLPRVLLTSAAGEVARRLGRPLLRADLGGSSSHFIGETEKNLQTALSRAVSTGAVLLFDEADALFGRRTDVAPAHDRYANQEISHLLAKLESHLGVVVMLFESAQEAQRRHGRLQPRVVRFPPA